MNPKKWSVVCWLLLILWAIPTVLGNVIFEPDLPAPPSSEIAGVTNVASYDRVIMVGFPFVFYEIWDTSDTGIWHRYRPYLHLFNVLLGVLNLFAVVYVVQTCAMRFSLKSMLVGVTVVGVLVWLSQQIYNAGYHQSLLLFLTCVYLFPVLALLPVHFYNRIKRTRQARDERTSIQN